MRKHHLIFLSSFLLLVLFSANVQANPPPPSVGGPDCDRYFSHVETNCPGTTVAASGASCNENYVRGCVYSCVSSDAAVVTRQNRCLALLGGGGGSCTADKTAADTACRGISDSTPPSSPAIADSCIQTAGKCVASCTPTTGRDACQGYLDVMGRFTAACDAKIESIKSAGVSPVPATEITACENVCKLAGQLKMDSCRSIEIASATPPDEITPDEIVDTPTDDNPGDEFAQEPEPVTTPDQRSQQQLLQGLSSSAVPNVDLGGYKTDGIGPQGGNANYGFINPDFSQDYSPDASLRSPLPFEAPEYGHFAPGGKADVSSGSVSAGGGMGAGAGGMNPMMAGGRPNAVRRSSGGSTADKTVGQTYFPPGGSKTGGTPTRRATASRGVAKVGPKYQAKGNNEGFALARLFGSPRGQALQQANPSNTNYYGNHCLDTVFCSMENFFQAVDRYPNSEIKDVKAGK